ncbi:MAG: 30S ribosomal protein S3 [Eubacteriales bacterium]|nr:30S ribosomal protein S3 [Eubacteriales bacterium]
MGQKVNPHGARVGVIQGWDSRWYVDKKDFAATLLEDEKVRKYLKKKFYSAGVAKIEIERKGSRLIVNVHTAKPGVIIGKGGTGAELTKNEVAALTGKTVALNIIEIKRPDADAQLIAENIASQLEKRTSFRRAMKMAMQRAMKCGVKGIKTAVSGRLGGAEIARREGYHEGSIPLQTLRADIDYGFAEAATTYGRIGVKVWVYKGEVLPTKAPKAKKAEGGFSNVNA